MQCKIHLEVWLYENMIETEGFCPKCQKWYGLKQGDDVPAFVQNADKKRDLRR